MWRGNGIYFISDRDGTMNLYRWDLGNKQTRKLTSGHEPPGVLESLVQPFDHQVKRHG